LWNEINTLRGRSRWSPMRTIGRHKTQHHGARLRLKIKKSCNADSRKTGDGTEYARRPQTPSSFERRSGSRGRRHSGIKFNATSEQWSFRIPISLNGRRITTLGSTTPNLH
jgi:hypothetical protein